LSLAIDDTAYDGSFVVVSTSTTLMPPRRPARAAAAWPGQSVARPAERPAGRDDGVQDRLLQRRIELLRAWVFT
jgi:hypothetical protein